MPELIGEIVHLLLRCLRRVAQISRRSDLRIARCPPLRSAAVRRQISAAYGAPVVANQPGDCGVRRGAEVVRIRHRGIAVSQRQKAIQHSRCGEGGVEITVPRRTPFQTGSAGHEIGVKSSALSLGS